MRTIKFRGKSKNDGRWIYGDFVRLPKDRGIYDNDEPPSSEQEFYIANTNLLDKPFVIVEPHTIGQYTGMKDKNDIEIYENDVVKCQYQMFKNLLLTEIGSIIYKDCRFCIDDIIRLHGENHSIEKIGNIFDNPELLGE